MEPQADAIRRIDEESTQSVRSEPAGTPKPGSSVMALRLIFIPSGKFLKSYVLKGGVFRGIDGLKSAVNEWALSFSIEAKRYEKHYADDTELKKRARDFRIKR